MDKPLVQFTDPTYLRTIHDGLLSGAVHKDNASALPQGLVGMYEEALPPAANLSERKKFLEFFSVWAFLKKEVSVEFVVPLLEGWTEEQVIDYIAQYSKWFNSPVSGKYVLYHERLRTFIVQKASHNHFAKCDKAIIQQCHSALQTKAGDEWERYALEYLSAHFLVTAMERNDATGLKSLAYDTTHWNRQVEISKGFEWSKHMLNDMMLWASKFDDDEVIECALNKVDLHHLEQNDAPRIVELVAQNDIEAALQRIESFGGSDKEGLQRKFILYMLCLMELTLLDSKEKPFRKEAIEKLLKHLDDNLPVDHSVLNWIDFYPDYLMFQVSYEFLKIGVDYNAIFVRTSHWEGEWIESYGPYTKEAWLILEIILKGISDEEKYFQYAKYILRHYIQNNGIRLMKSFLKGVLEEEAKQDLLEFAISELGKLGKIKTAISLVPNSSDGNDRDILLAKLSVVILHSGNYPRAMEVLSLLKHRFYKVKTHCAVSEFFFAAKDKRYLEHIHSALSIAKFIRNVSWSLMAARTIALTFNNIKRYKKAYVMLKETMLLEPNSEDVRDFLLDEAASNMAIHASYEYAVDIATNIIDVSTRNRAFRSISVELVKCRKFDLAQKVFSYIDFGQVDYHRRYSWDSILCKVAKLSASNNENKFALQLVDRMVSNSNKADAYIQIADSYYKNKNEISGEIVVRKAIESVSSITNSLDKENRIIDILLVLLSNHKIEFALELVALINDDFWSNKSRSMAEISDYFSRSLHFNDAIRSIEKINDVRIRSSAFKRLCNNSAFCEKLDIVKPTILKWLNYQSELISNSIRRAQPKDVSSSLLTKGDLDNALLCAKAIDGAQDKVSALISISSAYYRNQPDYSNLIFHEALDCAKLINNEWERFASIRDLAIERKKQGFTDEAYSLFTDALRVIPDMDYPWNFIELKSLYSHFFEIGKMDDVLDMTNQTIEKEFDSCGAYVDISVAWVKNGDLNKGISCARGIDSISEKVQAFSQISTVLVSISDFKNSADLMQEALQFARSIDDFYERHGALMSVCFELSKQGQLQEFTAILKEAHETALNIDDDSDRSTSLKNIAIQFAGLGDVSQSLEIISGGIDSIDRTDALIDISVEQSKQRNWKSAEFISLQIAEASKRRACWRELAKSTLDEMGLSDAILQFGGISESEMKIYFLKGLADSMFAAHCDKNFVLNIRQYFKDDIDSLLKLLHKHAINELFFQNPEISKIERFKRTLRIQWAIDVINKN
jgi:tetratricopeptide (TPR) repeat protein